MRSGRRAAPIHAVPVSGGRRQGDRTVDDLTSVGVHCMPVIDETRPTTNKNAIVAEGYRLLKVDTLDNRSRSVNPFLSAQRRYVS